MTPDHSLTFQGVPLARAVRTLHGDELQLLLLLALNACVRTGRVWTTSLRLAEELHVGPTTIDSMLSVLISRAHISLYSRGSAALRCYEISPALLRRQGEAPPNLPIEASP